MNQDRELEVITDDEPERSDSDILREIGMDDEADDLEEHLGGYF